jgi:hypothetical protein
VSAAAAAEEVVVVREIPVATAETVEMQADKHLAPAAVARAAMPLQQTP